MSLRLLYLIFIRPLACAARSFAGLQETRSRWCFGVARAGATAAEIVDVLVGVIPIIGLPSVVATAPKLAMALGYDTSDALKQ